MPSGIWRGKFWGKTQLDIFGNILAYLPLDTHCAEVAAVLEGMLSFPVVRQRLASASGKGLSASQTQRLCALAALHDIGKFTWGFQNKIDPSCDLDSKCGHIASLPGLFSSTLQDEVYAILGWLLSWDEQGGEATLALLKASLSHHGQPLQDDPASVEADRLARFWRPRQACYPLAGVKNLCSLLRDWFPLAFAPEAEPLPASSLFQHLFSGLVSLADWLASDTRFFPMAGEGGRPASSPDLMPFARQQAALALESTWLGRIPWCEEAHILPGFDSQFGFRPNALQQAVELIPLRESGGLAVIEAETGSGKTEAALRYFSRLLGAGLVDGLYFANPLRFAATQLQRRVTDFARCSFPGQSPPVALAVPGYLQVDDVSGLRLPGWEVRWLDGDEDPLRQSRYWAAENPKRFLCAPLAVGTIDQALMATLRLPHAHLRAAALSRSLLVVDEVHASDAYMTRLLLGLVELFRRAGGQVLLLSATLGSKARQTYLETMAGVSLGREVRPWREARGDPYPLISHLDGEIQPVAQNGLPAGAGPPSKPVALRLERCQGHADSVAALAAGLARQGACVLVLRNTVRLAMQTARAVEEALADSPELIFAVRGAPTLHHSRFAPEDRRLLDGDVAARFGKESSSQGRRRPGVLVATQTLEQSLDVDFDALLTDLCPMDVLLQRLGRLHRHTVHQRPSVCLTPQCQLLLPEDDAPDALFSLRAFGYGDRRAYPYLTVVEATRRKLLVLAAEGKALEIPAMNRELVEDATHPEALQELEKKLGEDWERHGRNIRGIGLAQGQLAFMHRIAWDKPFGQASAAPRREEDRAQTRLGLRDWEIKFAPPVIGPFGQEVSGLRLPAWMVGGDAGTDNVVEAGTCRPGEICFNFVGRKFVYDRLGLRHWGEEHELQSAERSLAERGFY